MAKFYVYKIVRDDGESLFFDQKEIFLAEENEMIARPEINSSEVNYSEADGGEMIFQALPPTEQKFNGLLVPRQSGYWELYKKLTVFFLVNHYYSIIYREKSGKMFSQDDCWLAENLQIPVRPYEDFSEWSVGMKIGRAALTDYLENADGERIAANSVKIPLVFAGLGGEVWDGVGTEWDDVGEVWEAGEGGLKTVYFSSSRMVYPRWAVVGPATNPTLANNTTNTSAKYSGVVGEGQTLMVDFQSGVAKIGSSVVSRYVEGEVSCAPGENIFSYSTENPDAPGSKLEWDNII